MKNKKTMTIVQLIKEEHKPIKEAIKVLTSDKSTEAAKKKALKSFLMDLKLHAKAEEMTVYKLVAKEEEVRTLTLEAIQEHAIADFLAKQLERSGFENEWSDKIEAKAKVLAHIVKHHAEEEEEELLPSLSEMFEREEQIRMAELFLEKKAELKAKLGKSPMSRSSARGETSASMMM